MDGEPEDLEKTRLLLKLREADILAPAIADARLNYGEPNKYEFTDERILNKYRKKLI